MAISVFEGLKSLEKIIKGKCEGINSTVWDIILK